MELAHQRLQLDGQSLGLERIAKKGRHPEPRERWDNSASRQTDRLRSAIVPPRPELNHADRRKDRSSVCRISPAESNSATRATKLVAGQEITKQTLSVSSFSSEADKSCVVPVGFKSRPDQLDIDGSELLQLHSRFLCRAILCSRRSPFVCLMREAVSTIAVVVVFKTS